MKRLLPVLMILTLSLLGGCQTLDLNKLETQQSMEREDFMAGTDAYFVKKDYAKALIYLKPIAENINHRNTGAANLILGEIYESRKNYEEAIRLYRLASKLGISDADNNLFLMYSDRLGVPKDDKNALKWFKSAADQGDSVAKKNMTG